MVEENIEVVIGMKTVAEKDHFQGILIIEGMTEA